MTRMFDADIWHAPVLQVAKLFSFCECFLFLYLFFFILLEHEDRCPLTELLTTAGIVTNSTWLDSNIVRWLIVCLVLC